LQQVLTGPVLFLLFDSAGHAQVGFQKNMPKGFAFHPGVFEFERKNLD
jgi:hypothetical protein